MSKLTATLRKQIREARSEKRRTEILRHRSAHLSLDREQRLYKAKK